MKTKRISKKLVLNKESISRLNHHEMSVEHGGGPITYRCTEQDGQCTGLVCFLSIENCFTTKCHPGPQG